MVQECKVCAGTFPVSEFPIKGGYVTKECRCCKRKRERQYYHAGYKHRKSERNKLDRVDPVAGEIKRRKAREYYGSNKEKFKKWIAGYKETITAYRNRNRDKIRERTRKYSKRKRETDPTYKLIKYYRTRIYRALTGACASAHTVELLGASPILVKEFISAKFAEGMTWENYGEWHIDHIRPCASFPNLRTSAEEQRECFHYTNLQPLWAEDNMKKSDKWLQDA